MGDDHDITELNAPGKPVLTVDKVENGEIKLDNTTYKIQSEYKLNTGGLITLTTTPDILHPKEGQITPDGYARVTFKKGEGVEFTEKVIDIKKGIKLPAEEFPKLTLKDGYRDAKWSLASDSIISEDTTIKGSATKNDDKTTLTVTPKTQTKVEGKTGTTIDTIIVETNKKDATITVDNGLSYDKTTGKITGSLAKQKWGEAEEQKDVTITVTLTRGEGDKKETLTDTAKVTVQRDTDGDGKPDKTAVSYTHLKLPTNREV